MDKDVGHDELGGEKHPANGHELDGKPVGNGNRGNDQGDALGNARANYGDVVARMPTERFASHYNMNHKSRGLCLIFNHETFDVSNLKARTGTDQDRKNLEAVMKRLGFEVFMFQDLKYHEIESHIKHTAQLDHSHYDCICVCVLSHGDTGILYAKDMPYKPDNLWYRFTPDRCPTLAGKPKIFLFQACQGDKLDSGVILHRTETDGQPIHSYRIPTQADFLVVYSTVKGYYSWRNTTRGSWFVQALCEELAHKALEIDLMTILTFVSQRVAFDYESNVPDSPTMHQQKQIPCIMSMLTRLIQFTPVNKGLEASGGDEGKTSEKSSKSIFKGLFHPSAKGKNEYKVN